MSKIKCQSSTKERRFSKIRRIINNLNWIKRKEKIHNDTGNVIRW